MTQGDHVRALKGGVWDHAIDVGDRTVVRFARGMGIQRCAYADFVDGAERVEVVVHRERVFRPPLVVARAFSRFAESAFNSMFATPEQFALWCKMGRIPAAEEAAPPARPARVAAAARGRAPARAPAARRARAKGKAAARKKGPARRKAPARKARKAAPRKKPAPRRARKAPARPAARRRKTRR